VVSEREINNGSFGMMDGDLPMVVFQKCAWKNEKE